MPRIMIKGGVWRNTEVSLVKSCNMFIINIALVKQNCDIY